MTEFGIIQKYFLSGGDDCALLKPPADQLLAVSIDTLISGVHFPHNFSPYDIGYKSLAVNLSDLAAMGAEPAWFTCALTLPKADENWISEFARGLFDCAKKYTIQLVGGDLTRGEVLSITIQVHGFVPEKLALKRNQAKIGESIYVSGKLGQAYLKKYYYTPEPRIALGLALRGKSYCAIDISDGLLGDLEHILEESGVGASLFLDKIPLVCEEGLTAGDDYELCFTAPAGLNLPGFDITEIGHIDAKKGLRIFKADGSMHKADNTGYQHFIDEGI